MAYTVDIGKGVKVFRYAKDARKYIVQNGSRHESYEYDGTGADYNRYWGQLHYNPSKGWIACTRREVYLVDSEGNLKSY